MSRIEILDGVRQVLRTKLDVHAPVNDDTHLFADLELDSLQQLTMVVELENHFRVCFEPGEEQGVQTVGDVVAVVAGSLEGTDAAS